MFADEPMRRESFCHRLIFSAGDTAQLVCLRLTSSRKSLRHSTFHAGLDRHRRRTLEKEQLAAPIASALSEGGEIVHPMPSDEYWRPLST